MKFLADRLSIDIRSLALFRIGLAIFLLGDLLFRAQGLVAHYTDFGLLPREALMELVKNEWHVSLHMASGMASFQILMFILAAICAFFLLIGYRTRLFTILSWILLISLQSRNPMILQGGDFLSHMMLFWGMFLPLGAAYSVDAALNTCKEKPPQRFFSVSTVALYFQIAFCYWFSVAYKSGVEWWPEGTAVYFALNADHFLATGGQWLLSVAPIWFLQLSTYAVIILEIMGPAAIMLTSQLRKWRILAVFSIIGLHIAFRFGLEVGIFPFIGMASVLAFFPSWMWDRLEERTQSKARKGLKIYYDGNCGFCERMTKLITTFLILPQTQVKPAQKVLSAKRLMKKNNSWVVMNAKKKAFLKWDALAEVVSHSPLWWWMAPLLRFWPIKKVGTLCYEWVANHRGISSRMTSFLSYRHLHYRRNWLGATLATFFIVYVFFWNISDLEEYQGPKIPENFLWIGHTLRIDQRWNMFSPFPLKDDGWWVMPAKLRNGTELDVFTGAMPVSYEKPPLMSALYPTGRWRKYMRNISNNNFEAHRLYYGRYICRKWNSEHPFDEQLMEFDMVFMKEMTLPNYEKAAFIKENLWKHRCF